jgi:hypothetical protein
VCLISLVVDRSTGDLAYLINDTPTPRASFSMFAGQGFETLPSAVALLVNDRVMAVPDDVSDLLLDSDQPLTADPAHDLLLIEQNLRWHAALLAGQLAEAAAEIADARAEVDAFDTEPGASGRRGRRAASAHLADAIAAHTDLIRRHQLARDAIYRVRGFVMTACTEVPIPDGWLCEAARGWARDPAVPDWITTFDTEAAFVAADPRRGVPAFWGGTQLGGVQFGWEWRRDGDEDDPVAETLVRAGPWWVAWLNATGEIYATRRSTYLPEQVWLLGTGMTDKDAVPALLSAAQEHMREPNSLLSVARLVHTNQQRRISAETNQETST